MNEVLTEAETRRFWQYVVKGPGDRDCWIWVGAIADDGYGRFWTQRNGRSRVLRPHRVAFALATGVDLRQVPVVEHFVCDNPVCVHAGGDRFDHLAGGTQADNLARMARRGRGGGTPLMVRNRAATRAELAAKSRALRDAVRDGWDLDRIERALQQRDPLADPALW